MGSTGIVLAALALTACASSAGTTSSTGSATTSGAGVSPTATTSSGTVTSSSTGLAAVPPACGGSGLTAAYAGTDGATGHLEVLLTLGNASSRTCAVEGYPDVRLLGAGGATLAFTVRQGGGFFADTLGRPRAVALAPGARARFGISFPTNSEYAHSRVCRTARAAMVRGPRAGSAWRTVSLAAAPTITPCGDQLVVSPLR